MAEVILIEGLIYGITALGVFISFRILDFPDLTVDGSFPLGAAIMAFCLLHGVNPALSFFLSFLGGCGAGLVTALIHSKLKVPSLLAGILTMTMLYSVNLRILENKANVSFLKIDTIFNQVRTFAESLGGGFVSGDVAIVIFMLFFAFILKILLDLFFYTDYGIAMYALGSNPQLITSYGMNQERIKGVGIALSNGLVALSGGLASLYNGYSDIGYGTGIIVAGLATVMLGEFLLRSNKIFWLTTRVLLGSILYRGLMFLARMYGYKIGMEPNDLKLMTGLLIIVCLFVSKNDIKHIVKKGLLNRKEGIT
ncbi:ABC transporter permease [Fibrobacterales bacterium]|nr:ABC transporter permease [Fibrobacterales bacterium]